MKKLLLILLCLPLLLSTCKKEEINSSIDNTGNDNTGNSGCLNNKYISFDVLGTSYFDDNDGTTKSKDGSYLYCQDDNGGVGPISAEYADITFNIDGTKDLSLDFHELWTSNINFKLVIKDIDNISANTPYSIYKYGSNTTVALESYFGVSFDFSGGSCTFKSDCTGEISFTSIDLVNNIFSGTFWLTAWWPGQVTLPQQCSDTIYISNGIFHDIDEGVY
jgi:hypothetical protein